MMQSLQEALKSLQDKLYSWVESIVLLTPNFIIAVFIFIVVLLAAKRLNTLVRKLLSRIVDNPALVNFLGRLLQTGVILFGGLISIKVLQLDQVVFSILAGVGIAGLAIGFAFQDLASNFIAGTALVFRKDYPFRVGDIIETNDYMGVVKEINLRDTMIETFQGQLVFMPNKLIFENSVKNYSLAGRRRVDLGVGISYGEDLERVRDITVEAVKGLDVLEEGREVELFFDEYGDSSINFEVRFWVPFKKQADFLKARSDAVVSIKKAYDASGIVIPFPIRTLDFGIKGGMKLNEVLPRAS
ncbi:MAG: mechanosensitive ion channel [Pseudomonadota bacterium]|jgi:small-conductance mechanosensitive channel